MDKKLLSLWFLFFYLLFLSSSVKAQDEPIINVGLIIKDKANNQDMSVKTWLFEGLQKINKSNGIYKYIFIDGALNNRNVDAFQYVMELEASEITQNVKTYMYTTKAKKNITINSKNNTKDKKDTKEKQETKTVTVDVPHSGVKMESGTKFIGRIYDIKDGKYLNGFIVDYKISDIYPDLGLFNDITAYKKMSAKEKRSSKQTETSIKRKYLNKYEKDITSKKASFKKDFIKYSFDKMLYNTAYCFHYPLEIIDITNKTKKKAKNVKLSGNKFLQDKDVGFICAEVKDEKGYKKFDKVAQFYINNKLYDKNEGTVRYSRKKVLKAFNENQRMVIGQYGEHDRFLNDTVEKKYTVFPIFNIDDDSTRKASGFLTYKFNHYLNDIPIFEVLDRGTIQDIEKTQELLKSDRALDSNNAFELRDQLKGADYIVLINIKRGVKTIAKLIETKTGTLLNTIEIDLPRGNASDVNFYSLVVPAFKLNTEIVDLKEASSSKVSSVYIKSTFPLKDGKTYLVYRVENRMVNGKNLERTVEIGEIEVDKLYSRTFAVADVKDGKKEILNHFNKGDKLICLPKNKKKGILGEIFDFKFDNYENIHTVNDDHTHSTKFMH